MKQLTLFKCATAFVALFFFATGCSESTADKTLDVSNVFVWLIPNTGRSNSRKKNFFILSFLMMKEMVSYN